jgi:DNA-binding FadR family transcriptional regulator
MPLQAVENRRLYRQIADQIAALIERGEYGAGAAASPERDLAKQLGVIRPSVREALIALEVEGYVEVRVGSGRLRVGPRASPPVAELTPTRALRAHQGALADRGRVRRARGQARHQGAGARDGGGARHHGSRRRTRPMPLAADRLFHLRIAEASGNSALALVVKTLWDQRTGPLFLRLEHHFDTPEPLDRRHPRAPRHRRAIAGTIRGGARGDAQAHEPGGEALQHQLGQGSENRAAMAELPRSTSSPSGRVRRPRGGGGPLALPLRGLARVRIFWVLALVIFYQFFTRYALNDSASWTEEIARYLLIATAFVGAAVNVRKNNHIQVDFFYRLLPRTVTRPLSTFVDVLRVVFLGYCVWLTIALMQQDRRLAHGDHRLAHRHPLRVRVLRLRADDVAGVGSRVEQLEARLFGARGARARRRDEVMGPGTFKLLFLGLMASGLPVAIAMAGASLVYVMVSGNIPDYVVIHRMVGGLDSFPLLAVPFFILAGNLMNSAGITNRIYNFALALVGWMRGGLGHVNVLGSVIFAGMSGTAIADAAGLGTIEIKAMTEHGYSKEFSVGVTAASATLGPIIPPSLPFVIYALFANVSVGALFLAGILPGVVMAILMMLTVAFFAHKNKWGADVPFQWPRS